MPIQRVLPPPTSTLPPQAGAVIDGANEDNLSVQFPSVGPLKWTSSRYNGGDFSLSIGPAAPSNPLSFPSPGLVNNFQAMNGNSNPIDPNSTDLTTLAWRVNSRSGALFATPRRNGADKGFTIPGTSGQPLGEFYGVSYFTHDFAQGWGFRMTDGVFANGGGGASDLVIGQVGDRFNSSGIQQGINEAAYDVATVYLPYEQGWTGGWVNPGLDGPGSFGSGSEGLTSDNVTWSDGVADVSLPGVDSTADGMLFVAPSSDSSNTRIASAYPNASGGWSTTVRVDYLYDELGGSFSPKEPFTSDNRFQFLYVPYDAENLFGANINGDTGAVINGAGQTQFSLTKSSSGEYALSVFAEDGTTKKAEDDGMLMLSVADTFEDDPSVGSQAFMSYEYDPESGDFLIESRVLSDIMSSTPNGGFMNEFTPTDTNFYFAWVDFENPFTTPQFLAGDYNDDGLVDAADYTVWRVNEGQPEGTLPNDEDGGVIGSAQYDTWKANFGSTISSSSQGTSTAVPEPSALLLVVASCGFVSLRRIGGR